MRTVEAQPGHLASEVSALLASRQFVYADCFTISLKNGDKLFCTSAQDDMVVTPIGGGVPVTFTSKGVKVSGLKMNIGIGVQIDQQDFRLDYLPTDLIQGKSIAVALQWGRFDGATVTRDRFFAATWNSSTPTIWLGAARMFSGKFSEYSEIGRSHAKIMVKSDLKLLNIKMPTTLYQPGCRHAVFDAGCGLDRSLFATTGTIGAGSTPSLINTGIAAANMQLGTIYVVSGAGVTLVRTIKSVVPGTSLSLSNPLEELPSVGTAITVYQGCDNTYARCTALANTAKFLGFPFIPVAETAY